MIYSKAQTQWLCENSQKFYISDLKNAFNATFCCDVSKASIRHKCSSLKIKIKRKRFTIHHFKKSAPPHNNKPIGAESEEKRSGYILVKINQPNKWKYKHVLIWEQHHNRKKPNGFSVVFLDNDYKNFCIKNLYLVKTKVFLAACRKQINNYPPELKPSLYCLTELEMGIKK